MTVTEQQRTDPGRGGTEVRPRVQVVVAHPDDESFGCGSLLLHARAAGAVTAVCCATRGEAGGAGPDVGRVRERELREAATLLGVAEVDLLSFVDSDMSGPAGPETLVGADVAAVTAAVRASLERFRPDVVVTLDASDGHRDHARVRDATLAAAADLAVPRVYLACLPRSLMRRWCDHMASHRPDMAHLDADVACLGTPDEELTTRIDVAAHREQRERAMRVHASQTSPYDGLPEDLSAAFLDVAYARRVVPAWSGGARESQLLPASRPAVPPWPGRPHRHGASCWWDLATAAWRCEGGAAGRPG